MSQTCATHVCTYVDMQSFSSIVYRISQYNVHWRPVYIINFMIFFVLLVLNTNDEFIIIEYTINPSIVQESIFLNLSQYWQLCKYGITTLSCQIPIDNLYVYSNTFGCIWILYMQQDGIEIKCSSNNVWIIIIALNCW